MNRRHFLAGGAGAVALAGLGAYGWTRSTGSPADYEDYARDFRAPIGGPPEAKELVRYAALAANSHNTQPWRFAATDRSIQLFPDEARRTPVVDPDDHHLFVSLGCAAENLSIAGRATGRPGELLIEPGDGSAIRYDFTVGEAASDPLFDAIPVRQSTRTDYDGRAISSADLAALERAAAEPGVRLVMLTEEAARAKLRDLIVAGNDAQMADPAFMAELKAWIRFNPRDAMRAGDGLLSAASGNPSLPAFLGRQLFSLFVTAKGEGDRYARQVSSSPAFAVLVADVEDKSHWMKVGRACQRMTLAATALGLKHAYMNQPVEVPEFRSALASLAGEGGRRPDLVLRLGYGPTMPYSPRRPVGAVLA